MKAGDRIYIVKFDKVEGKIFENIAVGTTHRVLKVTTRGVWVQGNGERVFLMNEEFEAY